jgi:hypothetical protein
MNNRAEKLASTTITSPLITPIRILIVTLSAFLRPATLNASTTSIIIVASSSSIFITSLLVMTLLGIKVALLLLVMIIALITTLSLLLLVPSTIPLITASILILLVVSSALALVATPSSTSLSLGPGWHFRGRDLKEQLSIVNSQLKKIKSYLVTQHREDTHAQTIGSTLFEKEGEIILKIL